MQRRWGVWQGLCAGVAEVYGDTIRLATTSADNDLAWPTAAATRGGQSLADGGAAGGGDSRCSDGARRRSLLGAMPAATCPACRPPSSCACCTRDALPLPASPLQVQTAAGRASMLQPGRFCRAARHWSKRFSRSRRAAAAEAAAAGSSTQQGVAAPAGQPMGSGRRRPACAACGRAVPKRCAFKVCGGCRAARYCDRECQAQHWLAHKCECAQATAQRAAAAAECAGEA